MKTTAQVDTWFRESVINELSKIPESVIQLTKTKPEYLQILTQSIARKLCFRENAVKEILITLI